MTRLLVRLIQYLAVAWASVPAGVLYVIYSKFIPEPLALWGICLPSGIISAYLAWHFVDKHLSEPEGQQ